MGSEAVDRALEAALAHFGVAPAGEVRYGWARKTAGRRVMRRGGGAAWLRVQSRRTGEAPGRDWSGVLESREIEGVPRPAILGHHDWPEDDRVWRAVLLECVEAPVCSPEPYLACDRFVPDDDFLSALRRALERLAGHETGRVAFPQALITRRLRERHGPGLDTRVDDWATIHDDLHWSNLTVTGVILDWEAWGRGPRGFDAALLLAFSAGHDEAVGRIRAHFGDWLDTRDGLLSQLLACRDVLHVAEEKPGYAPLRAPVERIEREALRRLVAEG